MQHRVPADALRYALRCTGREAQARVGREDAGSDEAQAPDPDERRPPRPAATLTEETAHARGKRDTAKSGEHKRAHLHSSEVSQGRDGSTHALATEHGPLPSQSGRQTHRPRPSPLFGCCRPGGGSPSAVWHVLRTDMSFRSLSWSHISRSPG